MNSISTEELESLAWLHIDIARRGKDPSTRSYYQKCYSILSQSEVTNELVDRSVYFPLYSGLFVLYKNGVINDGEMSLESLASGFVKQATIHGDPVHIARAIAMEGLTMASLGKYKEALESQEKLQKVYCAKTLSSSICKEYATDRAAQNYGYSVAWLRLLGREEEAKDQIDFIVNEIMPLMPIKNVHNSAIILFPVIWVLMDDGKATVAELLFAEYVCDRFYKYYGKGAKTFFLCTYKPVQVLLRLASISQANGSTENTMTENERLEIENWALSENFYDIKKYISTTMCPYGKEPHCIFAEICWYLASYRNSTDKTWKKLMETGHDLALVSLSNTHGKPGYESAKIRSMNILELFRKNI